MKLYDWHNTSWDLRGDPPTMALLPIGAVEQFGPHLPVGTQNIILDAIARRVGARLAGTTYLLPTLPLGLSMPHKEHAGTVWLSWRTLMAVVTDLAESLLLVDIHRLAVLVGLGGAACTTVMPREHDVVKTAVRRLNYDHPDLDAVWVQPLTVAEPALDTLFESPKEDVHAGEVITSLMLHLHPELVGPHRIDHVPAKGAQYAQALSFRALCPEGVWGHPSRASAELGARALEAAVTGTVSYIDECFTELARLKRFERG